MSTGRVQWPMSNTGRSSARSARGEGAGRPACSNSPACSSPQTSSPPHDGQASAVRRSTTGFGSRRGEYLLEVASNSNPHALIITAGARINCMTWTTAAYSPTRGSIRLTLSYPCTISPRKKGASSLRRNAFRTPSASRGLTIKMNPTPKLKVRRISSSGILPAC